MGLFGFHSMSERLLTHEYHTQTLQGEPDGFSAARNKEFFLQALSRAQQNRPTPYKRDMSVKPTRAIVDNIADAADTLGSDYTNQLLALTDEQETVFTRTFMEVSQKLPSPKSEVHTHHDHDHDHDDHHCRTHGLHGWLEDKTEKTLKILGIKENKRKSLSPRLSKSLGLVICAFDCWGPMAVGTISQAVGGSLQLEHHEEIPAVLPNRPRILFERLSDDGEVRLTGELPSLALIPTKAFPRQVEDREDYRMDDLVTTVENSFGGRHREGKGKISVTEIKQRLAQEKPSQTHTPAVAQKEPPFRKKRRVRNLVAATAIVAALGGIAGSAKVSSSEHEMSHSTGTSIGVSNQETTTPFTNCPTTVYEQAKPGDSPWKMVTREIQKTGIQATNADTNVLTDLVASENEQIFPDPDQLQAGQTLAMPGASIIQQVDNAIKNPASDPTLSQELHELNAMPKMSKATKIEKVRGLLTKMKQTLSGNKNSRTN